MKTTIKTLCIIGVSLALSFVPYTSSDIITQDFLTTTAIGLFGVTLTVMALLFTVLDRYKENLPKEEKSELTKRAFPVIQNICEDIGVFLLLIVLLFVFDIFYTPIQTLQKCKVLSHIDIERFLLLSILLFMLAITIDVTTTITMLVRNLININQDMYKDQMTFSTAERELISVIRKFDKKHFGELMEYIKTLTIKQELDK